MSHAERGTPSRLAARSCPAGPIASVLSGSAAASQDAVNALTFVAFALEPWRLPNTTNKTFVRAARAAQPAPPSPHTG
jgi:hypothetical protein